MKFTFSITLCAFAVLTAAHAAEPAPTAKDLRRYYSANLPEAKKVMQECVAKGFDSLQGEERNLLGQRGLRHADGHRKSVLGP